MILAITIIGIPFGLQSIKLGVATFCPFGKEVVEGPHANSPLRIIFNILWLILFGWEIALVHLAHAAFLALTVVGIPFAVQHVKLVPLSLFLLSFVFVFARKPVIKHDWMLTAQAPLLIAAASESSDPFHTAAAIARETSLAQGIWAEARAGDDFAAFAPKLEHLVDLARRKADALGWEESRYDALLDLYERGATEKKIAALEARFGLDDILFVKRVPGSFTHMSDQYYGWWSRPGGRRCC